jgi:1-phosphofructokinase family hexose kinase
MIYTLTLNPAVDQELTVDSIEFDTVLRATKSRIDFGGKGFNVSRQLKELGVESTAIGFLGGKAGEILQDGLRSLGIGTDFVCVKRETRTNVSIVTQSGGHYVKVNEKGPLIEKCSQQELIDKVDALARPSDWWVLAGSLPPGCAEDIYARIIHVLNRHGALTLLDTTGEPLRLGCTEKPYLVKPNAEEAEVLTDLPVNSTEEITTAAVRIREMGAQNVVISLGKGGALLQTDEGIWLVHGPEIKEKNPIGAGDSMVGGMIWALSQGKPLKESLGWGVASGAATASLSGTDVGSRKLIEELMVKITYQKVCF